MPKTHHLESLRRIQAEQEETLQRWKRQIVETNGIHFILDLDETLFNTAQHWVQLANRALRIFTDIPAAALPNVDSVLAAGGPATYYPMHFPEIFHSAGSFERLNESMRHRIAPNLLGEPMFPGSLKTIIDQLNVSGNVLGSLTARPESPGSVIGTQQQLLAHNTTLPTIYRATGASLAEASVAKLKVLSMLGKINPDAQIVLIDDSVSTAQALSAHNLTQTETPVYQFLFTQGGITAARMKQDPNITDTFSGISILRSWETLEQVTQEFRRELGYTSLR